MPEGGINPVAFAIPLFLGGVLIEAAIARARGRKVYRFGNAMSDLACGSAMQALDVFFNVLFLAAYAWVFEHLRLVDFSPGSALPWILAFVGVDFLFYWWHRASHVVNVLWAVHGVHHQSEDYNLAVALRQPAFEPITWFFFYVPLAFLGVPPLAYVLAYVVNRLYQFWIHTQLVDKMGPLSEWVLNTPSHHRVHHGVEDEYLDKNYGAILIVWDRLFGTFEPEGRAPNYGITVPIRAWSPVRANFHEFERIADLSRRARTAAESLWAWIAHPAWLPAGVAPPAKPDRATYEKYDPDAGPSARLYVALHFVLLALGLFVFVLFDGHLKTWQLAVGSASVWLSLASLLGVLEGRRWACAAEPARAFVLSLAVFLLLREHAGTGLAALVAAAHALFAGATWGLWLRGATPEPVVVTLDDTDLA